MNIPEKTVVEVYINEKWSKFVYIGSYDTTYGSMGMQIIQYKFPDNINEIESWVRLKDNFSPVDLLNHLFQLENDLNEIESIELYGASFYNNYLRIKLEVEKLKSLLLNELDSFIEENILWVNKGVSVNFDTEFYWSSNYEWARRDPDCIILFDEEMEGSNSLYLQEDVYNEVIDLLKLIWKKLLEI